MKSDDLLRKDIHLERGMIEILASAATKEKRPLKNYMEKILTDKAIRLRFMNTGELVYKQKIGGKKK